jgi:Tfp pilus assembly protein PilF
VEGALRHYRAAIDADPKHALAHYNLGNALQAQGDVEGALRHYRAAIDADPKHALAHYNLGNALLAQGQFAEARTATRQALDLLPPRDPLRPKAHNNLGNALQAQGDVEGALRHYRAAIDADPKFALAHYNLGGALQAQGQFGEARTATRQALDLLPPRDPLRPMASRELQRCEELLALDEKLPAVLQGKTRPADAAERLALADLCRYKQLYAASARFAADAFAQQPQLADDLLTQARYHAACAAALAGCGQGKEAAPLDDQERPRLRKQAQDWLRLDLALWAKEAESDNPKARETIQKTLKHWQTNADLAGVRDKDALDKLPEKERQQWQQLWAAVAAQLQRAERK